MDTTRSSTLSSPESSPPDIGLLQVVPPNSAPRQSVPQVSIAGILHDVAAKSHSATFRPKCLLSFNAPDERQMRPPHSLAKLALWQVQATESSPSAAGARMPNIRR